MLSSQETRTSYTFNFPEFNKEFTIEVPFTSEEIAIFQQARELLHLLRSEAVRGSGWQRDAQVKGVPWGYSLVDRKKALGEIGVLRELMRKITNPRFNNYHETDIAQRPHDFSERMLEILNKLPQE